VGPSRIEARNPAVMGRQIVFNQSLKNNQGEGGGGRGIELRKQIRGRDVLHLSGGQEGRAPGDTTKRSSWVKCAEINRQGWGGEPRLAKRERRGQNGCTKEEVLGPC